MSWSSLSASVELTWVVFFLKRYDWFIVLPHVFSFEMVSSKLGSEWLALLANIYLI